MKVKAFNKAQLRHYQIHHIRLEFKPQKTRIMKLLFTSLLVFVILTLNAQSYSQNLFDDLGYDTSIGVSDSEEQISFAHNESEHMEALVLMYETTNDLKYAETLIKCIGNVIDRRDDLRHLIRLPTIYDYRNLVGPTWATDYYNEDTTNPDAYAHLMHSASITYPMAKFAAMIKLNSSIQNIYSNGGGRYGGMKYIDIADALILRVDETLDYHENEWRSSGIYGWYVERSGVDVPVAHAGEKLPLNKLSVVGRTMLQMYRATQQQAYLDKVYKLSKFINYYTDDSANHKVWKYAEYVYAIRNNREDVGHAGLTISFPYECYKYAITYSDILLYSYTEMVKYAKTLTEGVYRSPLEIHDDVEAFNKYWNFKTNYIYGGIDPIEDKNNLRCDRWLKLSQFDRRLYQIVADLYNCSTYTTQIHEGTSAYTIAHLACFDNQFVPTNADHGWGAGSDWSGAACGNFDADDEDEFVVVRNYNGQFYLKQLYSDGFSSVTFNKYYGSTYNWAGIAAGNFFGDSKDEFVAISNHSTSSYNGYYVFKVDAPFVTEQTKSTGWGTASDWVGAAAGNFVSGGYEEFVAVRNNPKQIRVYKFNGTTIQYVYSNTIPLPANATIAAVASGNLDSDDKDEIVILVNSPYTSSNGYYVYDINDAGVLSQIATWTGWGTGSDWEGLAVGDIDADGIDEIISHRNYDGEYKIRQLCGSSLCADGTEYFPTDMTEGNIIAAGNLDDASTNEELIVLRNSDGGMVAFAHTEPVEASSAKSISALGPIDESSTEQLKDKLSEDLSFARVYPNPTTGIVNIELAGACDGTADYQVFNSLGQVVSSGNLRSNLTEVDISTENEGLFFIRLVQDQQFVSFKIFLAK